MLDGTTITNAIGQYLWPMARLLGLFISAPLFSERIVSSKVRIMLALFIALIISPELESVITPLFSVSGLWLIIAQIIIGVMVGLVLQLAFGIVQLSGEIIGLQMGLSFATFFDPFSGLNSPIIARLFNVLFMLFFIFLDIHLMVINVIIETFHLIPITPLPINSKSFLALTHIASLLFSYGMMLALPAVTVLLLLNIVLGIVNRFIPQFSIFLIGFPLILGGGLLSLMLIIPMLASFAKEIFNLIFQHLSVIILTMRG